MPVSPLLLMNNLNSYISGEVTIDPSAAIAPGVILQAEPNSRIIIAAGVCIGMGAIVHARDGILEIEAGAILGAGVLVVGKGKIGANASIGSATTIVNYSIDSGQVVAPSSLIGDIGQRVAESVVNHTPASSPAPIDSAAAAAPEEPPLPVEKPPAQAGIVYGKASVTQLIATLLPYNQSLNQQGQDNSSHQST